MSGGRRRTVYSQPLFRSQVYDQDAFRQQRAQLAMQQQQLAFERANQYAALTRQGEERTRQYYIQQMQRDRLDQELLNWHNTPNTQSYHHDNHYQQSSRVTTTKSAAATSDTDDCCVSCCRFIFRAFFIFCAIIGFVFVWGVLSTTFK